MDIKESAFYQAISKQYDGACEDFSKVFTEMNLCEHSDKKPYCLAQQTNSQANKKNLHMCCCYECRNWSPETHRCATLSLSCRAWICESIEKMLERQDIHWSDISIPIFRKYPLLDLINLGCRTTKDFDLEHMYNTYLSLEDLAILYDMSIAMGNSDETFVKICRDKDREYVSQRGGRVPVRVHIID